MKKSELKSENEKALDPWFKSDQFRDDVRLVLEYLGLQNNMGSFREHDWCINWIEFADNIRRPRWFAIVDIVGSDQTYGLDLFGKTRDEAISSLDPKCYKFNRWF